MSSILEAIGDKALRAYLTECAKVAELNVDRAFVLTKSHIRAFNNGTDQPREIAALQDRWYRSLSKSPDYSVYDDPTYFCDLWLCWTKYSRRYLNDIQKPTSFGSKSIAKAISPKRVLDLGCGFGYTTGALKQLFPSAEVVGTNIANTSQFKIATKVGKQNQFKVISNFKSFPADLVFASEYFEHWEDPISHLLQVIKHCRPKHWLIANAFTSPSIGHFPTYKMGSERLTGRQTSKLFRDTLRGHGYVEQQTTLWNKRPAYWRLKK